MKAPILLFVVAFLLRIGVRLVRGEDDFWTNGYQQYSILARNIANSSTYCLDTFYGIKCAFWPPVYPIFVTVFSNGSAWYWPLAIAQAAVGGLTAVLVFQVAQLCFDRKASLIAGVLTAVYPYYLVHDVSLQDTALFGFVSVLSVYLLILVNGSNSKRLAILCGLVLGAGTLTRATLLPFVVLVIIWIGMSSLKKSVMIGLVFCGVLTPWLIRNYIVVGSPILTSQSGRFLWIAHNPHTFSHYPVGSIDESEVAAWSSLSAEEQEVILGMNEIEQSRAFQQKGLQFIIDNPGHSIYSALVKIETAFSWKASPAASPLKQTVYFISYFPVLALALVGVYIFRRRWKDLMPIYLMIASFGMGASIYWAHTSHRSILDGFFIILASPVLSTIMRRIDRVRRPHSEQGDEPDRSFS